MLDEVLSLFAIRPDSDLNVMQEGQTLGALTARIVQAFGEVLETCKPDLVLVHGDTTTCFAAALASYYAKRDVGHVEAGLRTQDKYNPFPEEVNRRLVDALSDVCFAPTEGARQNLLREGISDQKIVVTGNTVIDALQWIATTQADPSVKAELERALETEYGIVLDHRRLILVTGHRRESFGEGLQRICEGLRLLAELRPDVHVVYPVHLNPQVRGPVYRILRNVSNVTLCQPVRYDCFVSLLAASYLVLTDSGGIQEEAPALGKPVLVMREKTERPEAIESHTARLVGTDPIKIRDDTVRLLDEPAEYRIMAQARNPFGDGHASERIAQWVIHNYGRRSAI
jgi:UDP-N-acetylglucosamine 2-epimerase (non-hydrolysing)